ncbi:MAG: hypothetical protein K9L30_01335 [Desulfobacterales bacterium]|nr:hypothetical protein [Desulfobacterales bacterium]
MNIGGIGSQMVVNYNQQPPSPQGGQSMNGEKPSIDEAISSFMQDSDADGSSTISSAEFKGPEDAFSTIDADGSGEIDSVELQTMFENAPPPPPGGMMGMQGGMGGMSGMGGGMDGGPPSTDSLIASLLESFDTDDSGTISSDELETAEDVFSSLDINEDGVIDQSELETAIGSKTPPPQGMMGGSQFGLSSYEDAASLLMESITNGPVEGAESYLSSYSSGISVTV